MQRKGAAEEGWQGREGREGRGPVGQREGHTTPTGLAPGEPAEFGLHHSPWKPEPPQGAPDPAQGGRGSAEAAARASRASSALPAQLPGCQP